MSCNASWEHPAQFILTGSANPDENAKQHSGAGRFTTLDMHTMSWQELGYSIGTGISYTRKDGINVISLSSLGI